MEPVLYLCLSNEANSAAPARYTQVQPPVQPDQEDCPENLGNGASHLMALLGQRAKSVVQARCETREAKQWHYAALKPNLQSHLATEYSLPFCFATEPKLWLTNCREHLVALPKKGGQPMISPNQGA